LFCAALCDGFPPPRTSGFWAFWALAPLRDVRRESGRCWCNESSNMAPGVQLRIAHAGNILWLLRRYFHDAKWIAEGSAQPTRGAFFICSVRLVKLGAFKRSFRSWVAGAKNISR